MKEALILHLTGLTVVLVAALALVVITVKNREIEDLQ